MAARPQATASSAGAESLQALSASVVGLDKAKDLKEAIEQCKSGLVAKIRAQCSGTSQWSRVKQNVTRRERVYDALVKDFNGDEKRFYLFFTATEKEKQVPFTFMQVVNYIAACRPKVQEEKGKEKYLEDGKFSAQKWEAEWEGRNEFEIYRVLSSA